MQSLTPKLYPSAGGQSSTATWRTTPTPPCTPPWPPPAAPHTRSPSTRSDKEYLHLLYRNIFTEPQPGPWLWDRGAAAAGPQQPPAGHWENQVLELRRVQRRYQAGWLCNIGTSYTSVVPTIDCIYGAETVTKILLIFSVFVGAVKRTTEQIGKLISN